MKALFALVSSGRNIHGRTRIQIFLGFAKPHFIYDIEIDGLFDFFIPLILYLILGYSLAD